MSSSPEPKSTVESDSTSATSAASPGTLTTSSVPITTDSPDEPRTYPPMTTQWSTPLSCTFTYDISQELGPGTSGPIAYLDLEPVSDASTLSCYPDGMFFDDRTGTFSPGTCPNGWTTVSVRQNTAKDEPKETTTAVCCSSEYSLDGTLCKRELPTVLAVPIVYNTTSGGSYDVLTDETSTLLSATLAVYAINALFQEKDKDLLGLTYEDEITDESGHTSGLSLGSRIGIGIGATIGGLLLIAVTMWLLCRKRKAKKSTRRPSSTTIVKTGLGRDQAPPAYGFARRNGAGGDAEDGSEQGDDDIETLRAQKAAIQRRIEELERVDTHDDLR